MRVEGFAWLAVTTGIGEITFWNLVKYPDMPGPVAVRALAALDDVEPATAIACFDLEIAGGFIEELRPRIASRISGAEPCGAGSPDAAGSATARDTVGTAWPPCQVHLSGLVAGSRPVFGPDTPHAFVPPDPDSQAAKKRSVSHRQLSAICRSSFPSG